MTDERCFLHCERVLFERKGRLGRSRGLPHIPTMYLAPCFTYTRFCKPLTERVSSEHTPPLFSSLPPLLPPVQYTKPRSTLPVQHEFLPGLLATNSEASVFTHMPARDWETVSCSCQNTGGGGLVNTDTINSFSPQPSYGAGERACGRPDDEDRMHLGKPCWQLWSKRQLGMKER